MIGCSGVRDAPHLANQVGVMFSAGSAGRGS